MGPKVTSNNYRVEGVRKKNRYRRGRIYEFYNHQRVSSPQSGAAYVASAAHDSSAEEAGRLAAAAAIATW